MYACASVYVFECFVCTVSVFKRTFTSAITKHEEKEKDASTKIDVIH